MKLWSGWEAEREKKNDKASAPCDLEPAALQHPNYFFFQCSRTRTKCFWWLLRTVAHSWFASVEISLASVVHIRTSSTHKNRTTQIYTALTRIRECSRGKKTPNFIA